MAGNCYSSHQPHSLSDAAPPLASLFGILTTFALLFLLVWIVFRRHLATFPGMSKKKIFATISVVTLCIGYGINWHLLHGLYKYTKWKYIPDQSPDSLIWHIGGISGHLPTYGNLMSIYIPILLFLLAVLIGRVGKKLLSLPVRRNSKKMALVLYPLVLLGIALAFPILVVIESAITGSGGDSPHITHVVISALALTVSVYALGIALFTKHLAAIFKTTQKKNIILILGAVALGIGGLSASLYYNFSIFYSSFVLVSVISSLIPLCVLVCIGAGKLFRAALQLSAKKQSRKLAYSVYAIATLMLFIVLWSGITYTQTVIGPRHTTWSFMHQQYQSAV